MNPGGNGQILELALLGNTEIRLDRSSLISIKSNKAKALLCYLAATGQAHNRTDLACLLWGNKPEDAARMNLSQALSTLRRLFKDNLIITRQTIAFNQESSYWLDVAAFEACCASSPGRTNTAALKEAAQLYRGEFLENLQLRDAPEFEMWVLTERARLQEMALTLMEALMIHFVREEIHSPAIKYARRVLAIEPWHERAHRELIRLLAQSGRRSAALIQFERCRQILQDELGVEPEEDTIALYELIRDENLASFNRKRIFPNVAHRKSLDHRLESLKILDQSSISTNIPYPLTSFIGREQEINALSDMILNRGLRLITLIGPGGIGKTRLAIEFAERRLRKGNPSVREEFRPGNPFADGIFFVPLEAIESRDLIVPAIAESMHYRLDQGESQLIDYLSSKRALFILDNFEHLLDGGDILFKILQAAPDLRIIVTSRERLRLHGEQLIPLDGLTHPDPARAIFTAEYSAAELFLQAAKRLRPDFSIKDTEIVDLARMCWLVEGMPLALELAATWIDTLPISNIVLEIQKNMDFLSTDFPNIPKRHRSMRATIDVSWESLSPADQTTFSRLSVFRGGFTLKAATKITGTTLTNLSTLVRKSLLNYSRSRDRYHFHEILRQYGSEKLSVQSETVKNLSDKHSQYYCQWFANQINPRTLKFKGQKTVLDAMTADLENTRAAWTWALKNDRTQRLIGKTLALGMYYVWRGGYKEGERTFREFSCLLTPSDMSADPSSLNIRASILNWQAFFLGQIGENVKEVAGLLRESLSLMNSPGLVEKDTRAIYAQNSIISARYDSHHPLDIRLRQATQAQSLERELGHPSSLSYALVVGARLAILIGQTEEARQYLEESLEICEHAGDQLGQTFSLTGLGNLAFTQNEYEKSERLLGEALDLAIEMNSLERIIVASLYIGIAQVYSGQFRQAQHTFEECVIHSNNQGLKTWSATSRYFLGFTLLHLGIYDQSVNYGKAALHLAVQANDLEIIPLCMMLSAAVALTNGDFTEAYDGFTDANSVADIPRSTWVVGGEDCGWIGRGLALLQLGKINEAQMSFIALLQQAISAHRQDQLLYALAGIACLTAKQVEIKEAVELYALAASYPFVGKSRWFADTFGKSIEAASRGLPAGSAEKARIKGMQLNIWETANALLTRYI